MAYPLDAMTTSDLHEAYQDTIKALKTVPLSDEPEFIRLLALAKAIYKELLKRELK